MEIPEDVNLSALRLMRFPDPVLAQVCAEVGEVDEDLRRLAEGMFKVMQAAGGMGLAAPQVGVPVQVFVVSPALLRGDHGGVYVNPRLIDQDGSEVAEEGCLSLPGVNCRIKRAQRVTIRATDLDGAAFSDQGEGLAARVFQHEMDHLNGVLIAERMSVVARLANRRTLKELRQQYDDRADRAS